MAVARLPEGGLTLHAPTGQHSESCQRPVILCKLDKSLIQDARKAAGSLHFISGAAPKIRLGKRTIDLTISSEAFRHELYSASLQSLGDLNFAGVIHSRASLKLPDRKHSVGTDAALAALQRSLASFEQEKQAKQAIITTSLLPTPKNRFDAAKAQKDARRRGMPSPENALPANGAGSSARSVPAENPADEEERKNKAMRLALVHLLAVKPRNHGEIRSLTRIPALELETVLRRVGEERDGKWQLAPKAFRELDAWKFPYASKEDRQAAVDNAVKAYDRQRLGKDDNLWQMLLPPSDRGKGICLSRLQLGNGALSRNLTPNPHGRSTGGELHDDRGGTLASSPRMVSSTPKSAATKANAISRLLSKDPKKAQAAEAAKEKKRKEREIASAASDREGPSSARKKQTTKINNPKIKSAELVYSSDDEDPDPPATKAASVKPPATVAASGKPGALRTPSGALKEAIKSPTASRAISGEAARSKPGALPAAKSVTTAAAAKPSSKPAQSGKTTPNGLAAPSGAKPQYSPQAGASRPHVPSPLGAARPRNLSDPSDPGAVANSRQKPGTEPAKAGASSGGGRLPSVASRATQESGRANGTSKESARKAAPASLVLPTARTTNGTPRDSIAQKRKPVDSPTEVMHEIPPVKQRKVSRPVAGSMHVRGHSGSDSSSGPAENGLWSEGALMAERFFSEIYPKYSKMYDDLDARERRGDKITWEERERFNRLHARVARIKREAKASCERGLAAR